MSSPVEAPGAPAGRNARRGPYQGLIPYTEEDAAWFFGRDAARAVVLDNLLAYRVSILFGSSGVGKSSLLRAGVVRQVRDEGRRRIADGEAPEYAALHFSSWAEDPVAGLQAAIGGALRDLSPELADGLPEGGSLADTVAAAALRVDGALLVILDQFEEYFLYHDADGPFVTQLARLLARRDTAASVLITIREDSLAKLDALAAHMPGLLDNLVRIEHLDRAAARAAIVEPLELWNRERVSPDEIVEIEPELAEAVLDGVQTKDSRVQTPYLQIVLTRLWDEERGAGSRALRLSTLKRLGGAARIVAEHVDNAIATLSPGEQAIAASVLRQLVTPSGTKIALRTSDLAELAGTDEPAVAAVLERLTREARILQAVGGERYEIYHDALAEPILEWRRRWQARQDRLRERRRNRVVAAVGAGLVLTVVVVATLAVLAWLGQRDADRQARDARAVALASASASDQLARQPDVALLLGLAGLRERDRFETRSSLIAARQAAGPETTVAIIRGHTKTVNATAFLRGGRTIVSAGDDGALRLSDVASGRPVGRPFATNRGKPFLGLAVSPDKRLLAAGDVDGIIRLWDIASRRAVGEVATRNTNLGALAFSPDGRLLATGADESPIMLWSVPALRRAGRSLAVPDRSTYSVTFSPDGREVAAVGSLYTVRRWSVRTRRRLSGTFVRPGAQIVSVAFSPNGRTIATAGARALLWNIRTRRAREMALDPGEARTDAAVSGIAFSSDGRRLAGAGEDGVTRVWDVRRPHAPPLRMSGPAPALAGVAFSPNGRLVASFGEDRRIWLLDPAGAVVVASGSRLDDLAFDRTGRTLAGAPEQGPLRFWTARTGRLARLSKVAVDEFGERVFAADASRLATSGTDGRIDVWDPRTPPALVARLPGQPGSSVAAFALSPSADRLASSAGSTIALWDVAARRRIGTLRGHRGSVSLVAFSSDGRTLASADEADLRLWDLRAPGGPKADRVIRQAAVGVAAFGPDDRTLASVDDSAKIRLIRLARGGVSGQLDAGDGAVLDVAFSPDGRMLLAGDETGSVTIWDVAARRRLGRSLDDPSAVVNHVAVSRDGRTFAAGGADSSVRLWSHVIWRDKDELREEICDLVGTDLSRAEWEQYAAGVEYRRVCDR